ncbi:ROK family transcriptional regulator [Labedella phragmitis]|uniref:ROK family transcriptional regulator n=3 Tax=Microbacteriaceae TaxID=85023 RepID=A0A444Q3J0_9MICO|nr:ROK family transcriptional regulator [Labedella phragmitis]RWZ58348.1 ROK family transcriptional regulator [Labedella populi]
MLNDRKALALLIEHGPLTKNELARRSGLSKPTAAEMVRRLEEAELISVDGEQTGRRGPAAVTYGVRADREVGVAIDVTPSVVRSVVVDVTGREYPVHAEPLIANGTSAGVVLQNAIDAASAAAGVLSSAITAVSVGIQAAVDPRTDELLYNDFMPGWPRQRVRSSLSEELGVDVVIENDANLAAVAERSLGGGADVSSFALLWIGEGLGVAVDIGGRIHRGATGGAGEIGYLAASPHMHAADSGELVQDLVAAAVLVDLARDHGLSVDGYPELLALLGSDLAASPRLADLLDDLAPRVGTAMLPLVAVLDPELVVLAGPTGSFAGVPLAQRVERWMADNTRWSPRVATALVDDAPVLRGARLVLLDTVRAAILDSVAALGT